MDTSKLAQVLNRAASMMAVSGALSQSKAIASVAELVEHSPGVPVEAFVNAAKCALDAPKIEDMSVLAIVDLIDGTRRNRPAALAVLARIKTAPIDKTKLIDVAALLTGGKPPKSKPLAMQAIQSNIEQRLYIESKEAQNEKVTPW
jgi:hypothetical protein